MTKLNRLFENHKLFLVIPALVLIAACGSSDSDDSDLPIDSNDAAPTITLSATPAQVEYNGESTLRWSTTNATSCAASGGWSGTRSVSGVEVISSMTATTTFSLLCVGPGGSSNQSVSVSVTPAGTPVLILTADPSSVNAGQTSTLFWTSTNVDTCTASGDWTGSKAVNGQETVGPLQLSSSFTLFCTGQGGNVSKTVSVAVNGAATPPTLSFSADSTSINAGEAVNLSWSTTNANTCTASGDWSGSKATNGQEQIKQLQSDSIFTLMCEGDGGSVSDTINVSVAAAPDAPTLTFNADRTSINAGESVNLFWSTTNANTCTASGDWSGDKSLNSQEQVGPLQSSSSFTLTCQGDGGSVNNTVNVAVANIGGGDFSLQGAVDSHFIDSYGINKVYVYAGNVQPDDYDGDAGDPLFSTTVAQDSGACTYSYGLDSDLADGLYTVAFTADAANDNSGANDTLSFNGTTTVNVVGGSATHDFTPSNVVRVGAGQTYTTVRAAAAAVPDNTVVEIDAGTYVDDVMIWRRDNLTIRGVNGRAHMRADSIIPYQGGNDQANGKGIFVIWGDDIRVENIEFSKARVPDHNGAGIRGEGSELTVCNSVFHDNENGILGGATKLIVEYSEFYDNGSCEYACAHNLYINHATDRLVFRYNYTHESHSGHTLKSRAKENYVLYNRIMDEATGDASYLIDLPNGGLSYVIGNLIQQGPNAENSIMLRYGAEGIAGDADNHLYVVNNTFVNDRGAGTFIRVDNSDQTTQVKNNLFVGGGTVMNGSAQQTTNLVTNNPGFVNQSSYDYRLTAASPAIDGGTAPGSGDGYSLTPTNHYVHPYDTEQRVQSGVIDIGAYEYTP